MPNPQYPVVIYAGANPPSLTGTRVIHVAPASAEVADVLAAVVASGITPSDLRNKTVFLTDLAPAPACAVYAALCGFAGRRVDVAAEGQMLRGPALDQFGRDLADSGRPVEPVRCAQWGGTHPELVHLDGPVLEPETVSAIRYAKRLRFVPGTSTFAALAALVVIGGIRAKGTLDRLPFLVAGDEAVGDDPTAPVGVCLDTLKREGAGLKRAQRSDDRSAVAEPEEVRTVRRQRIRTAADTVFTKALEIVGARPGKDDETGTVWHCPRPHNHANGDATPSFRVDGSTGACPRCDVEPVGALRLVVEVLDVSVDEAAALLTR